jgi:hypothetical protein
MKKPTYTVVISQDDGQSQQRARARELAGDPATPPEVLAKLSRSVDEETLIALTRNPNTPLELLFGLAETYPIEFSENPMFPLLLLEDPKLSKLPEATLAALVGVVALPTELLEAASASENEKLQAAAAARRDLPAAALRRLADSRSAEVKAAVAKNPNTPGAALIRLSLESDLETRLGVAQNANTPRATLIFFSKDPAPEVRAAVAKNPSAPPEALSRLSKDAAAEVAAAAKAALARR